jgi:hypothetical protein
LLSILVKRICCSSSDILVTVDWCYIAKIFWSWFSYVKDFSISDIDLTLLKGELVVFLLPSSTKLV